MRLSLFIRQEIDLIVTAWEEFARAKLPLSRPLSSLELQDDARILLLSIADDIESEQSAAQQQAKARGERPGNSPALTNNARAHAQHREPPRVSRRLVGLSAHVCETACAVC